MTAQDHRLYHRLQQASHAALKAANLAVSATGATTAQLAVMTIVASEESTSQRMIAKRLGVNESAVTAMASRLLEIGYLQRRSDVSDRRRRLLALTDSGRRALRSAQGPFGKINAQLDSVLDPDEVELLVGMLDRVRHAMLDQQDRD